jgi:hypothetical protein
VLQHDQRRHDETANVDGGLAQDSSRSREDSGRKKPFHNQTRTVDDPSRISSFFLWNLGYGVCVVSWILLTTIGQEQTWPIDVAYLFCVRVLSKVEDVDEWEM